jgi:hypothetical protein
MRAFLVSEKIGIPEQDYYFPGELNRSGVKFRPEL